MGKLVLVTSINPTPYGEGKTTTTIGLIDSLNITNATMDYDNAHENDDVSWDEYRKGEIRNI